MTDESKVSILKNFFYAAVSIGVGILCYFWFAGFEREGGTIRTNSLVIYTYELLGKVGVLVIFEAIGFLFLVAGIRSVIRSRSEVSVPQGVQNESVSQ